MTGKGFWTGKLRLAGWAFAYAGMLSALSFGAVAMLAPAPAQTPEAEPAFASTGMAVRPASADREQADIGFESTAMDGLSTEASAFDQLHAGPAIKRILKIDEPFVHGFWIWDDEGVPDGEIIITVDLAAESLSVWRGGYEIGAAAISFGVDWKPTPTGTFPITEKDADHVSNLYDAPMPYMLRMTNDGISIHGADVEYGFGTHGCIGVPTEFARLLFEQVKLGDRVIVTNGKMMDVGTAKS